MRHPLTTVRGGPPGATARMARTQRHGGENVIGVSSVFFAGLSRDKITDTNFFFSTGFLTTDHTNFTDEKAGFAAARSTNCDGVTERSPYKDS
jgi:hypothetical protein